MASGDKTNIPDIAQFDLGVRDDKLRGLKTGQAESMGAPPPLARTDFPGATRSTSPSTFDPRALEAIRDDPYMAHKLEAARDRAQKGFLDAIEQTLAAMPKNAIGPSSVTLGGPAVSGRRLMIDSRRGEMAGKSRRDLAEAMALEAVLNLGNPDWDPARPETSRETPNLLLALLRDK